MSHPTKTSQLRLKGSGGIIALEALQTYRSHMYLRYERPNECSLSVQLNPLEARALAQQLIEAADFMQHEEKAA